MKVVTVPVIVVALGLSTVSAGAFQETTIGGGTPPQATENGKAGVAPAAGAVGGKTNAPADLSIMTPAQRKASQSSESGWLRIPGLGELGVLPKMNFGLELLYGQGESREAVTKPQDAPLDELTIRGSVKHNF